MGSEEEVAPRTRRPPLCILLIPIVLFVAYTLVFEHVLRPLTARGPIRIGGGGFPAL